MSRQSHRLLLSGQFVSLQLSSQQTSYLGRAPQLCALRICGGDSSAKSWRHPPPDYWLLNADDPSNDNRTLTAGPLTRDYWLQKLTASSINSC